MKDTYFFSAEEALRIASQENRINGQKHVLQLCYYNGEKIDSPLVNFVHLPINNLVEYLSTSTYRAPETIDFNGLDIIDDVKVEITSSFSLAVYKAMELRQQKYVEYAKLIKERKLNFDEPLRFYIPAHASTEVMQFASKSIADNLILLGYDVFFDLHFGIEDNKSYKQLAEFNPHVTININHLNNTLLSEDVFNIVWFQDPMPIVVNSEKIELRKRDIIFSIGEQITSFLIKKGIEKESIYEQPIRVNPSIYNINYDLEREKKIVFIGGPYEKFDPKNPLVLELMQSLMTGNIDLLQLSEKYKLDFQYLLHYLYPAVVRQSLIMYICLNTDLKVEIYGPRWEDFSEFAPYYKGVLNYGTEIAEVYNTAKYGIVTNGYYQQRLFEMASCGTIPIVFDSPIETEESKYKDSCIMLKTLGEFSDLLKITPKNSLDSIVKDASYNEMISKVLNIIDLELNE